MVPENYRHLILLLNIESAKVSNSIGLAVQLHHSEASLIRVNKDQCDLILAISPNFSSIWTDIDQPTLINIHGSLIGVYRDSKSQINDR